MKYTIYLLFLICSSPIFSQETQNAIEVVGETEATITIDRYNMLINIKEVLADGYRNLEAKSLDEVTNTYKSKLKTVGIDFAKFQKNTSYKLYAGTSEINEVMYYNYTSNSSEEVEKIMALKTPGVRVTNVEIIAKEKSAEELATISHKAILNAKSIAQKMAEKLNKNIGDIIAIRSSNTSSQYIDINKITSTQKYYVTVSFKLL